MPLTLRVLLGLVAGLALGVVLRATGFSGLDRLVAVADPIGGLWLDALRMTIVPLVFSLIVTGMVSARGAASRGGGAARALGLFAVLLLAAATVSALVVPLVLQAWPVPAEAAKGLREAIGSAGPAPSAHLPPPGDWIRSFIPTNPVKAAADGAMAPLVIFAVLFALAACRIPEEGRSRLAGLFEALGQAMLVLVGWVLSVAPVGVFALAVSVGARAGLGAAGVVGHYLVILSGVSITMTLLQYPLAAVAAKVAPWRFARAAATAQVTAFSTQSSIASLPAMLRGAVSLGVSNATADVVLPLAVSLFRISSPPANLAVALYIASVYGISLAPGQVAVAVVVAAVVSLAAVGLPGQTTFFTTIVPICLTLGVPLDLLPIFLAVETVPDIFRTVGNVTADLAVTAIVGRRPAQP
ncbi:dicarboxylate/amino acid:cation symporter [Phenylobacterium sp.]|uniref:dicarboxylate/amino acid:cation symporter n=1 Tax=Phenylobacterium sp. TaxID=1871053 RepID=UPI0035B355E6